MKVTTHKSLGYEDLKAEVKRLEAETVKQKKQLRRKKWAIKALATLLALICTALAVYLSSEAIANAVVKEFVPTVPTLHVKRAEAAEVKLTKKAKAYTIPQIVDAVHILESSGGVKDGCIAKGKINGFGFAQHGSGDVWNCYKNYAQVRALVEQWFAEKVPAMGLPTALCYYNTGYQKADCPYYQNFLQVVES